MVQAMNEPVYLKDAVKLGVGSIVVVSWYSKNEGGQRNAGGRISGVRGEEVRLTVYPHGDPIRKLKLLEPRPRALADQHGIEYELYKPNEKEASSILAVVNARESDDVEVTVELTPRDVAVRLLTVMVPEKLYSTNKLCELGDVEHSELVDAVLQKLREAKKLKRVKNPEGKSRWRLA